MRFPLFALGFSAFPLIAVFARTDLKTTVCFCTAGLIFAIMYLAQTVAGER